LIFRSLIADIGGASKSLSKFGSEPAWSACSLKVQARLAVEVAAQELGWSQKLSVAMVVRQHGVNANHVFY